MSLQHLQEPKELDQVTQTVPSWSPDSEPSYQIPSCLLRKSEGGSNPHKEVKAMQDFKNILEKGVELNLLFLDLNALPTVDKAMKS